MTTTITNRREAHAWQKLFEETAPQVGDIAPDFELPQLNGNETVRLSQFRGHKPVALSFGSYT